MNEIANAIQKEVCGHLDRNTLLDTRKAPKYQRRRHPIFEPHANSA